MKIPATILSILLWAGLAAVEAETLQIWVSILPQQSLAQAVGGEHVEVHTLVQPGQSPATYEPTPRQMARLADADLLFRIGVPFEKALLSSIQRNAPGLNVADTRRRIRLRSMAASGNAQPDEHGHGAGADPHCWLDPVLALVQAANMADALCELDPQHAQDYHTNLRGLSGRLLEAHARAAAILAPLRGRTLLVFHPAYGYFTDAYGLKQRAVEHEGKAPTGRHLARLIDEARGHKTRAIFVQPQFASKSAETIARSIGAEVVLLDPLAPDLVGQYPRMAARIRDALLPDGSTQ